MTEPNHAVCPYLGMAGERTVVRTEPDVAHRCFAETPLGHPAPAHQTSYCLSSGYVRCPIYLRADQPGDVEEEDDSLPSGRGSASWARIALIAIPALLLLAVAAFYLRDLISSPAGPVAAPQPTAPALVSEPTASPTLKVAQPPAAPTTAALVRPAIPTAEPGGQILTLTPMQGQAGWWTGADAEGNYAADSYLYAGYYGGNAFISAARFDINEAARGAPITLGSLQLTGLLADRFDPAAGGTWSVQLLPGSALPPLDEVNFQTLFNAPAAVTLFPNLYPADLAVGDVNVLNLDESALAWLKDIRARGETEIVARIVGPGGGGDSLFAWDSGDGPATAGESPRLVLGIAPPPPTVPPLPTDIVRIATLTPTPANLLTAAADALQATQLALAAGTTPMIPVVTPTPTPGNLATAQVVRLAQGLRPYVLYTATPANAATATAYAAEATAVAITTGTFTPVAPDAITPVIVLPTEIPENPATAAAQLIAATRQATAVGTSTPLPPDYIIATRTATPYVIVAVPTAENRQTAAARSMMATAVAVTTGTYTPFPPNSVTATPTPRPTGASQPAADTLLVYLDQITPSPTPTGEGTLPRALRGKVLYWSDRTGGKQAMALDPATGRQAFLTQDWLLRLAERTQLASPDGRTTLSVQADELAYPQIFSTDNATGATQKLTSVRGGAFDPAFSPSGDRIAFASWEAGNEEIYLMNPDGSNVVRLTSHPDIDRHPTWSPDGAQLAFWSQRDTGRRQLWVMNADGSNQRRLATSAFDDYDPIWVR